MEFSYFPAHGRGLIIRMLIAHLDFGAEDVKLNDIPIGEFFGNPETKKQYGSDWGQLPSFKTKDGRLMGQQNAILRYLAKAYKGKDGTNFYPGPSDPLKSYWID